MKYPEGKQKGDSPEDGELLSLLKGNNMPLADSFFGWFVILMLYVIIGINSGVWSLTVKAKGYHHKS